MCCRCDKRRREHLAAFLIVRGRTGADRIETRTRNDSALGFNSRRLHHSLLLGEQHDPENQEPCGNDSSADSQQQRQATERV